MNNHISHKIILSIDRLYKFSTSDLNKIRAGHRVDRHVFNILPRWTITNNGKLIEAECWLQFTGLGEENDDTFYLFDLSTTDELLKEEISNTGYSDLFEDDNWGEIIKEFYAMNYEQFVSHPLPNAQYLLVRLTYDSSCDYYGAWDYDMYCNIYGYLDSGMDRVEFENKKDKI